MPNPGISIPKDTLAERAAQTLALMHQWGYAPSVETLATGLLGGAVPTSSLLSSVRDSSAISILDGFVYLDGNERLVAKSRARVASHQLANGEALFVAREFADQLARFCPVVECIALSGSAASGGYSRGDDVDFDLFTRDSTKYLVYAVAIALGIKAAFIRWRSRGLRKLICINVIWTRSDSRPFARQDESVAFELLRCQPLIGAEAFDEVILTNEWMSRFFPQLSQKHYVGRPRPEPNLVGRVISRISRHPELMAIIDWVCRGVTRAVYEIDHLRRNRDPIAVARIKFLQQVKYPYEVFQD